MLKNLKIVEIELFNYCNRTCSWCPNKYIDRRNKFEALDFHLFLNLLQQLKDIDYKGVFSFSRYNEPFAENDLLHSACEIIKQVFPENKLVSNTNGDYLTKEILDNCLIDELTIMDYDCKGKDWCYERLQSWGFNEIIEYEKFLVSHKGNLTILYYFNWPLVNCINNRGGNLEEFTPKERRTSPCFEPLYFIGINYDGTVSPCCNIRNDCKNKELIMGSLKENTLQELWDKKENKFLRNCVSTSYFPMYCAYCENTGGRYTTRLGQLDY